MDNDRAHGLLDAERERIELALAHNARATDQSASGEYDSTDLASAIYQGELDQSLANELRQQLAAVDRADQRLANGTYGLSIKSGRRIPDERLEIRPTAELTADEERAHKPAACT